MPLYIVYCSFGRSIKWYRYCLVQYYKRQRPAEASVWHYEAAKNFIGHETWPFPDMAATEQYLSR